jgi:hypothetical protein
MLGLLGGLFGPSPVKTEVFMGDKEIGDLFGGHVPPIGATVLLHVHKDVLDLEGEEPDDEGMYHGEFKVVSVKYDVTRTIRETDGGDKYPTERHKAIIHVEEVS